MGIKYRHQNVVVGDTIRLRMDVYNSNNFANVHAFDKVEVFFLDPTARTDINPDGRVLFKTFNSNEIVTEGQGQYYIDLVTESPSYVVGKYVDSWGIVFKDGDDVVVNENLFEIYPDLWITSSIPIIYDFSFRFTPSKIVQGSKKYLRIEIIPQVPSHPDLVRYYQNLAIVADVTVTIERRCGECLPEERDLRIVVEDDPVQFKEKCMAYYLLDTEPLDCGIYNVKFKMNFGDNVFISEPQQLQIYD